MPKFFSPPTYPYKLRPIFFLRPEGACAPTAPPGYAYGRRWKWAIMSAKYRLKRWIATVPWPYYYIRPKLIHAAVARSFCVS